MGAPSEKPAAIPRSTASDGLSMVRGTVKGWLLLSCLTVPGNRLGGAVLWSGRPGRTQLARCLLRFAVRVGLLYILVHPLAL